MSQHKSDKREKADFFKSYKRAVPAKRTSSTITESENHRNSVGCTKKTKQAPETPAPARFTNISSSPLGSPFGQFLSPRLPIRSPKSNLKSSPNSLPNQFSSPLRERPHPGKVLTPPVFTSIAQSEQDVEDGKERPSVIPDSDDSESLESLEDIFGRTRDKPSPITPPEDESKHRNSRPSLLGVFSNRERQAIVGKDKLRTILAKGKTQKFDITKLIDDHLDDAETKEKLDRANAYYQASVQQANTDEKQDKDDQHLLRHIIDEKGGDQTEIARVFGAMERTGTLTSQASFSFFGPNGLTDWTSRAPSKQKFPYRDLPQDLWRFREIEAREDAYLYEEVEDLIDNGKICDAVLDWTFETVVQESNDDLREAYIRCLQRASSQWTRTNLRAQNVQDVFEMLGADTEIIKDGAAITPIPHRFSMGPERNPKYLLAVLKLFKTLANDLDFEALSKLSSILIRLSLDEEYMSKGEIAVAVEDLLAKLLCLQNCESSLHVAERILLDIRDNLKDRVLQARLLRHIAPASPTATRLRLSLAQTFLFGDNAESATLSANLSIPLQSLLEFLESPVFDLTHRAGDKPIDYTELAALTHFVDVAMPNGGPSFSFPTATEEKAFNLQVDQLADRVSVIFSSIADTGASHMRRTEAKEALGVLHKYLLFKVRTKPRPKKTVFGGRDGKEFRSEQRSKEVMRGYLMKTEKSSAQPLLESDVDVFPGSQLSETEAMIRKQLDLV